jgi:hypothetical protein
MGPRETRTWPRTFLTPPLQLSPLPSPPPPAILEIIRNGKKFSPDLGTSRILQQITGPPSFCLGETVLGKPGNRSLSGEFEELFRVLLWDMVFANTPARAFLPKLYISSSRYPSNSWMRAHADDVARLHSTLKKYQQAMLSFAQNPLITPAHPARALKWKEIDLFFEHSLLVEGDKDGSLAMVSKTSYQSTVARQLASSHSILRTPNYELLDPPHARNVAFWERIGETWQLTIRRWVETLFGRTREPIQDYLLCFLNRQPKPRLPQFYLLAKTHKLKPGVEWTGRPIVGMSRWATTGASRALGVLAQLLLKLDALQHPMETPLQDALDLTHRLDRILPTIENAYLTTIDFESLYTNLTLQDAIQAISFWERRWRENEMPLGALSEIERDLIRVLFQRIPSYHHRSILEQHELREALPVGQTYTLAHFLMACVFKFSIFIAPGLGIYKQKNSFAMGTNCAPAWANAILRMHELQNAEHLTGFPLLARYIDDIVIAHTPLSPEEINSALSRVYPPHLPFTIQQTARREIRYLDLLILSLQPLVYAVGWKATHKGVYIPWNSNTPRTIKLAWVRGETIRMLRLSSTRELFEISYQRLVLCLQRLGYPRETHTPKKITWDDRPFYLQYKNKTDQVTHLLRVPFHQRLAIPWGNKLGGLRNELALHPKLKPNQRLFLSLKPPPTLRQITHQKLIKALTTDREEERRPEPRNASAFVRAFHHVIYGGEPLE